LPYSWHHCACNGTGSDAVPVTCLTVGITVPATALALMQYQLLALVGITVPATALALMQYWLLALQLASLCLQRHWL